MNDLSTDFSNSSPVEEGRVWTDAVIEDLKMLHRLGDSASQIAAKLKRGLTRNAVIGKLHRLGLTNGSRDVPTPPREPRPSRAKGQVASPPITLKVKPEPKAKVLPIRTVPVAAPPEPKGPGISLMQLRDTTCKWPVGDPGAPDFHFCGASKPSEGGPYCSYHASIAYQPPVIRKPKVIWNHGKVFG